MWLTGTPCLGVPVRWPRPVGFNNRIYPFNKKNKETSKILASRPFVILSVKGDYYAIDFIWDALVYLQKKKKKNKERECTCVRPLATIVRAKSRLQGECRGKGIHRHAHISHTYNDLGAPCTHVLQPEKILNYRIARAESWLLSVVRRGLQHRRRYKDPRELLLFRCEWARAQCACNRLQSRGRVFPRKIFPRELCEVC